MDLGLIRPSSNPYASSVVMVKKKDGTLRMCIDFRSLNKKTVKNRYPIPRIDGLMEEIHWDKLFSKIDLRSSYHQFRMEEEDIPKTAFRFHYGHFVFIAMLFGLTNAHGTFQLGVNNIFHKQLHMFVLVFFNEIFIYSKTWKEHLHI